MRPWFRAGTAAYAGNGALVVSRPNNLQTVDPDTEQDTLEVPAGTAVSSHTIDLRCSQGADLFPCFCRLILSG